METTSNVIHACLVVNFIVYLVVTSKRYEAPRKRKMQLLLVVKTVLHYVVKRQEYIVKRQEYR